MKTYMVVWSGGHDAPSYVVKKTTEEAWTVAYDWQTEMDEDEGDFIDVLEIDTDTMTVERLLKEPADGTTRS